VDLDQQAVGAGGDGGAGHGDDLLSPSGAVARVDHDRKVAPLLHHRDGGDVEGVVAEDLPIIDYHCHLSPKAMAADHRFRSISEIWLEGDQYKWGQCASMGDFEQARPLGRFLDRLDETDQLAKTILHNLNPADNAVFATMIGNFQDGSVPDRPSGPTSLPPTTQHGEVVRREPLPKTASLNLVPTHPGYGLTITPLGRRRVLARHPQTAPGRRSRFTFLSITGTVYH